MLLRNVPDTFSYPAPPPHVPRDNYSQLHNCSVSRWSWYSPCPRLRHVFFAFFQCLACTSGPAIEQIKLDQPHISLLHLRHERIEQSCELAEILSPLAPNPLLSFPNRELYQPVTS